MALEKTPNVKLGIPEHYDPSMQVIVDNMDVIDSEFVKATPNKITHTSVSLDSNVFNVSGRYVIKTPSGGCPLHSSISVSTTSAPNYSFASATFSYLLDVVNDGINLTQRLTISGTQYMWEWIRFRPISANSWTASSAYYWVKLYNGVMQGENTGLNADLLDGLHGTSYFRTNLTATSFNAATAEGKYRITSSTNAPYSGCTDWVCVVYHLSGGISELYQIAYEECHASEVAGTPSSVATGIPRTYIRKNISGTWYAWQENWHSGTFPRNHATTTTDYGLSTATIFGHNLTSMYSGANVGYSTYNAMALSYNVITNEAVNVNDQKFRYEGTWTLINLATTTNFPAGVWTGKCIHMTVWRSQGDNSCHQLVTQQQNNNVWIRNYYNGTWSAWEQILSSSKMGHHSDSSGINADMVDGLHGKLVKDEKNLDAKNELFSHIVDSDEAFHNISNLGELSIYLSADVKVSASKYMPTSIRSITSDKSKYSLQIGDPLLYINSSTLKMVNVNVGIYPEKIIEETSMLYGISFEGCSIYLMNLYAIQNEALFNVFEKCTFTDCTITMINGEILPLKNTDKFALFKNCKLDNVNIVTNSFKVNIKVKHFNMFLQCSHLKDINIKIGSPFYEDVFSYLSESENIENFIISDNFSERYILAMQSHSMTNCNFSTGVKTDNSSLFMGCSSLKQISVSVASDPDNPPLEFNGFDDCYFMENCYVGDVPTPYNFCLNLTDCTGTTNYEGGDGNVFVACQHLTNCIGKKWGCTNVPWTESNDGSGSGLDADTLDGKHSSELFGINLTKYTTFASIPYTTYSGYCMVTRELEGFGSALSVVDSPMPMIPARWVCLVENTIDYIRFKAWREGDIQEIYTKVYTKSNARWELVWSVLGGVKTAEDIKYVIDSLGGDIPLSNYVKQQNLNADMIDGLHAQYTNRENRFFSHIVTSFSDFYNTVPQEGNHVVAFDGAHIMIDQSFSIPHGVKEIVGLENTGASLDFLKPLDVGYMQHPLKLSNLSILVSGHVDMIHMFAQIIFEHCNIVIDSSITADSSFNNLFANCTLKNCMIDFSYMSGKYLFENLPASQVFSVFNNCEVTDTFISWNANNNKEINIFTQCRNKVENIQMMIMRPVSTTSACYFNESSNIDNVIISDGHTINAMGMFQCNKASNINITLGQKNQGYIFRTCNDLEKAIAKFQITSPNTVAFSDCSSLKSCIAYNAYIPFSECSFLGEGCMGTTHNSSGIIYQDCSYIDSTCMGKASDTSTYVSLTSEDVSQFFGGIPKNNAVLNEFLNADMLDSKHSYDFVGVSEVGDTLNKIPRNNNVMNTGLNADRLDGRHASDLVPFNKVTANTVNFNNFISTGFYLLELDVMSQNAKFENAPLYTSGYTSWGLVVTETSTLQGSLTQMAFDKGGSKIFVRSRISSILETWTKWKLLSGIDEIEYSTSAIDSLEQGVCFLVGDRQGGNENTDMRYFVVTLPTKNAANNFAYTQYKFNEFGSIEYREKTYGGSVWTAWKGLPLDKFSGVLPVSKGGTGVANGTTKSMINVDKFDDLDSTDFSRTNSSVQAFIPDVTGIFSVTTSEITSSVDTYGVVVTYVSSSNFVYVATSITTGRIYRKTNDMTAWNEITSRIPVLASDPTSTSVGEMWIRSNIT